MKVIKIKHETVYELRDVSIKGLGIDNLVVDNLTREQAKELLPICQAFFRGDVRIIRKEVETVETITTSCREEYIDYCAELQEMGNL